MKPTLPVLTLAAALIAAALGSGCATGRGGDPDPNGDLPWNTPATWEGSPTIPGLSGEE